MAPGWEDRVTIHEKDNIIHFVSWTEDDGSIIDYFCTFSGDWLWEKRYIRERGMISKEDAAQYPAIWLALNEMKESDDKTIKLWMTQWDDPTERVP
jgi:hypothetical protein